MPKTVKGGPLRFFNNHSVAKFQKKLKGNPLESLKYFRNKTKQDGNVPSRRHILGSKIFKEQLLEKFGKNFFFKKILIFFSKKKYFFGRTMPKNSKRGHSGSFNVFYKPKTSKKFKGVPFDKFRKFSKKVA